MAYPFFPENGPVELPFALTEEEFGEAFADEGEHLEFKQGIPETKVREAVVAFSNTDGGVLLLGVRDDGTVQGIGAGGEIEARVHRAVLGVRNAGRYAVQHVVVGDKNVVVVSVSRRREGFAQMQDGRVLVRRGAMNTPLFADELSHFVARRALARFESTPVDVLLTTADHGLLDDVRNAYGWPSEDLPARLREIGLAVDEAHETRLTVAGALYLTRRPDDTLGKAFVEIFRYRDRSDTYDKRLEINGPLTYQVEETVRQVVAEIGSDVVVLGVRRHELPRIPEPVLREAVANAVAHRVYENTSQSVRIEIRADRVEIKSPGGLPEPVTLQNMRQQNAARNINVIKTLRRFGLAEDAGMGVDVMVDVMEAALLEIPRFDTDGSSVTVTLPLGSTVTPQERAWIAEVEQRGDIHVEDRILLLHAARGEVLTNTGARGLLSADSTHARGALQRLRDLGFLVQQGARGGATYVLDRSFAPPAGIQLDSDQLRQIVTELAKSEVKVTNESVRARTHLDRAQVLQLLSRLVDDGVLERRGQRRGTYYALRR